MNLVVFFRGRQEKIPDYQTVIECNFENFVPMVAVTAQKAVPSIAFSTAKGNLEREQEMEDTMLDLTQPFTEGLEERDASSSTPTARSDPQCIVLNATAGRDPQYEVVEEKHLDDKLP